MNKNIKIPKNKTNKISKNKNKTNKLSTKPKWNDFQHDLDKFKLSKDEINKRKQLFVSKNSAYTKILSNSIKFIIIFR